MAEQVSARGGAERPAATIEAVAALAGVSRQTVSNALNAPHRLRVDTLHRVQAAIVELDYRPHHAARSLRTQATRMLGYCVEPTHPEQLTPVLDRFLHALTQSAAAAGHRIVLFTAQRSEDEVAGYDELLRARAVDGFVLSHTHRGDSRQQWLADRGVPFVSFGRTWGEREVGPWVDVDGAAGTRAAVGHLARAGRRRIGFLGWPEGSGVGDDRLDGWSRGCADAGLTPGPVARSLDQAAAATEAAAALLAEGLGDGLDAVVCASDTLAVGVYRALAARGQRPGEQVAVVGFDDSPVAGFVQPGLSSLRQPLEQVGRECVRLVLDALATPGSSASDRQVLLTPELVVRDSSRRGVGSSATSTNKRSNSTHRAGPAPRVSRGRADRSPAADDEVGGLAKGN